MNELLANISAELHVLSPTLVMLATNLYSSHNGEFDGGTAKTALSFRRGVPKMTPLSSEALN